MTVTTKNLARTTTFNLPNQLTTLRLGLSVVLFVLIAVKLYTASFVIFLVAVSTDWVDGYLARRYGMVTTLGRILDPFADKIIICGTFIFLLAVPDLQPYLQAWMVVVIVGRELLITALRSFLEQRGRDFSAVMSGKLKMVLQCVAAGVALFYLAYAAGAAPQDVKWLEWLLTASVWAAVLMTIYSGVSYVRTATALLAE
ncbi:MAG: CDP-diacylglycerol--glycerol-3-phosphate 3-phosphatidyltransferase [Planctomycetia bacterium]|nr:CDP-diacylglycerol--glycerol-3-phosphate 3-phosphatidyltransferase [Planctomycetia bacterium]